MPTGNTFGTTVITFRNSRNGYVGTINVTVKGDKMESIVASSLTAGTNFHAALKADGTVWTWGDNTYGQLGDGTKITRGYQFRLNSKTEEMTVQVHLVAIMQLLLLRQEIITC